MMVSICTYVCICVANNYKKGHDDQVDKTGLFCTISFTTLKTRNSNCHYSILYKFNTREIEYRTANNADFVSQIKY